MYKCWVAWCVVAAFFSILHSWLNAFAEMLRFADRLFYKVRLVTCQWSIVLSTVEAGLFGLAEVLYYCNVVRLMRPSLLQWFESSDPEYPVMCYNFLSCLYELCDADCRLCLCILQDWWNSTTFANYYRTWNVVVHDWLYCYVYKECYLVCLSTCCRLKLYTLKAV